MTYLRDDDDEENGQLNNPIIEEYEDLGGGAYLNRDSGEVVNSEDIIPSSEDDEGNGKIR